MCVCVCGWVGFSFSVSLSRNFRIKILNSDLLPFYLFLHFFPLTLHTGVPCSACHIINMEGTCSESKNCTPLT